MNFKLHNKYEIKLNDKTFEAHNTLLKGVYRKISKLEQYTSHIAVGQGQAALSFKDSHLTTFTKSFKAETEEISADISNETLFIKKIVSFDETDETTFSFTELGLCSSPEQNPEIFNHVLLTSDDGEVLTITKAPGDVLQIRVTVYLELESETEALFAAGENPLIKRLLGEEFAIEDNNLYAVRGECLTQNIAFHRCVPDMTGAVKCTGYVEEGEDSFNLSFTAKLGKGKTEELLLVYGGEVCMRLSTLELKPKLSQTKSFQSKAGDFVELMEDVASVEHAKVEQTPFEFNLKRYGSLLTDKNPHVFDRTFTKTDRRFVSRDGNMIAFISGESTYLYKLINNNFKKLYSNALPSSGVLNLSILDGKLVYFLDSSPYIRIFEVDDNDEVNEVEVVLVKYEITSYPMSWIKAEAVLSGDNILCGLIVNNENKTPVCLKITRNSTLYYVEEVLRPTLDHADYLLPFSKNAYDESAMIFITTMHEGALLYGAEKVTLSGNKFVGSSEQIYALLTDCERIAFGGTLIISQKTAGNPDVAYFFRDKFQAIPGFNGELGKHFVSFDGEYVAVKTDESEVKFFKAFDNGNLAEFDTRSYAYINGLTLEDICFLNGLVLIFSSDESDPLYSFMIKQNLSRLENCPEGNLEIALNKYDFLGLGEEEGVMFTLTLKILGT